MNENTNAVGHLQSAKQIVLQEKASISVVGRPLTPEEAKRLQALEATTIDIDNAITHLEEEGVNSGITLPTDGSYQVSNANLMLELRIDLNGSNIISGDIFTAISNHREYIASLRSQPGVKLTPQSNPLPIVAEASDGQRTQGQLEFNTVSEADVTAALTLDAPIHRAITTNRVMSFAGRFMGKAMRELGLELEFEVGTENSWEWNFNGRRMTVEACLEDAGFAVFNVGHRSQIPAPTGGRWADSQLHGLMFQFAQEPLDRKAWNLHLLMLQESSLRGLLGVMFDSGSSDINQMPRQGAAVFQRPIKTRPDWQRKLIQTTVHELAHALNLAHRFERPVGRADSHSFMNYDWKYLGGDNVEKFWRNFAFTFDSDELAFLRHGPWDKIVPGGAEFHTVPYWENTDGGYVPYIPEIPSADYSIRLVLPPTGTLFQFGQPVLLTVELTNNTGRIVELPKYLLDPKAGFLEFVIKRQTSPTIGPSTRGMVFQPVIHRCFDLDLAAADIVHPGGKLSDNVNLTFGSAGFTFAEPGNYQVTAIFVWQDRYNTYTIKSDPLPIRIAYPKTMEEEQDAQELFRWDVGYYFALGGSDVLSGAEDVLNEIVERRQGKAKTVTDPLVANILRSQAINQSRDFIIYRNRKFEIRPANEEKALSNLTAIRQVAKKILDPETSASTTKLTETLKQTVKTE